MKINKFAQSTITVENSAGSLLLIDPGKYNFDEGRTLPKFQKVDVLILTHKHEDHFYKQAVKDVYSEYQPHVITNQELAIILAKDNIPSRVGQVGDRLEVSNFKLELIRTDHVVRDEVIVNFGVLIESDDKRIYYASDTRLMEAEVLPYDRLKDVDVLCVPISNRGVVMGFDDALFFCNQFRPKMIVPMHYDSPKDRDRVQPADFVSRQKSLSTTLKHAGNAVIHVLRFGQCLEVS